MRSQAESQNRCQGSDYNVNLCNFAKNSRRSTNPQRGSHGLNGRIKGWIGDDIVIRSLYGGNASATIWKRETKDRVRSGDAGATDLRAWEPWETRIQWPAEAAGCTDVIQYSWCRWSLAEVYLLDEARRCVYFVEFTSTRRMFSFAYRIAFAANSTKTRADHVIW